MSKLSSMFEGAEIVEIEKSINGEGFLLSIETKCPFVLSVQIEIPNDPMVFGQVDIPAYDGRNVLDWIESL